VVAGYLAPDHEELHLTYPVTTGALPPGSDYEELLGDFYDQAAGSIRQVLDAGRDVAVLCEGDPFFHGSFMYLYNRLAPEYPTDVVPGVTSMLAGAALLGTPLVCQDEVLDVLPGTLAPDELERRLRGADAVVVLKVGRHLGAIRTAVDRAGLLPRAWYVERATMDGQRVLPLADADADGAPYFSMVVIPSATASDR
jgi:precorrin-2/cobalt-factor-2 C20-methyltransferase